MLGRDRILLITLFETLKADGSAHTTKRKTRHSSICCAPTNLIRTLQCCCTCAAHVRQHHHRDKPHPIAITLWRSSSSLLDYLPSSYPHGRSSPDSPHCATLRPGRCRTCSCGPTLVLSTLPCSSRPRQSPRSPFYANQSRDPLFRPKIACCPRSRTSRPLFIDSQLGVRRLAEAAVLSRARQHRIPTTRPAPSWDCFGLTEVDSIPL